MNLLPRVQMTKREADMTYHIELELALKRQLDCCSNRASIFHVAVEARRNTGQVPSLTLPFREPSTGLFQSQCAVGRTRGDSQCSEGLGNASEMINLQSRRIRPR